MDKRRAKKRERGGNDEQINIDECDIVKNYQGSLAKLDKKIKKKSGGFQSMGFSWQILKAILNSGYKQPTPIQRKSIPEILLGKDVVAMARTGSGKTASFLIPMLQKLQERENNVKESTFKGPKALIMSPTRELAIQTFKFTKLFAKYTSFTAAVILGGDKIEDQFETIHQNPDIIIATPGRFLHICMEMNLKLNGINYVVFDEADRLFEMGFKDQLNEILHKLPTDNRQTLLFSATLPASLVEFARAGLQNPSLIRLDTDSKLSEKLKMAFFQVRIEDKLAVMMYLINDIIKCVKNPSQAKYDERLTQCLIFVATKHHVEFLKDLLEIHGFNVSYAYSSLDQTARQINIAKFQTKKSSIMIVTDVAARGIDIPMLDYVINFNFPAQPKLFVHRVGRVARAGEYGNSFSLITNDELPYMHELHEFLGKQIRFAKDDIDPEDWNEVYGSVPQSVIDIEKDSLKALIDSKIELQAAFKVQENGYKQYLKSRPIASYESVRATKNIRLIHPVLAVHPIFKTEGAGLKASFIAEENLLDQIKKYKTKSTVFEINKTAKDNKGALIMRKKRLAHDNIVNKYKNNEYSEENVSLFKKNMYSVQNDLFKKDADADEEEEEDSDNDENAEDKGIVYDDSDFVVTISNNDENNKEDVNGCENLGMSKKALKRSKQQDFIDKENFIPYKPKNFQTEKGLNVNKNFNQEVSNATMDMIGDDKDEMHRSQQKVKWDRKKKKFVSVQGQMEKTKKIKTESGAYIQASYKSNLYAKWLKNSKAGERYEDQDDQNSEDKKNKRFFGAEKKYFGSHKFKSTGKPGVKRFQSSSDKGGRRERRGKNDGNENPKRKFGDDSFKQNGRGGGKRGSAGLLNKDQIMKERNRKEKVKGFQSRNKSGGRGGSKSGSRGGGGSRGGSRGGGSSRGGSRGGGSSRGGSRGGRGGGRR